MTRWPTTPRPQRPIPVAEVELWARRHHDAIMVGPAAAAAVGDQYKAWCRELGIDPVAAIQAAAVAKMVPVDDEDAS
jgi:hypothetical protein